MEGGVGTAALAELAVAAGPTGGSRVQARARLAGQMPDSHPRPRLASGTARPGYLSSDDTACCTASSRLVLSAQQRGNLL
jgi:hypothetical protein